MTPCTLSSHDPIDCLIQTAFLEGLLGLEEMYDLAVLTKNAEELTPMEDILPWRPRVTDLMIIRRSRLRA